MQSCLAFPPTPLRFPLSPPALPLKLFFVLFPFFASRRLAHWVRFPSSRLPGAPRLRHDARVTHAHTVWAGAVSSRLASRGPPPWTQIRFDRHGGPSWRPRAPRPRPRCSTPFPPNRYDGLMHYPPSSACATAPCIVLVRSASAGAS